MIHGSRSSQSFSSEQCWVDSRQKKVVSILLALEYCGYSVLWIAAWTKTGMVHGLATISGSTLHDCH